MSDLSQRPQRGGGARRGWPIAQPLSAPYIGLAMPDPTHIEIEARLETVEAHTDTKIARLEGKLDNLMTTFTLKLDSVSEAVSRGRDESKNSRWIIVTTVIGSMFALGALVVAMLTYGDAVFGRGMEVHKTIRETVQEMQKPAPEKK